MVCVCVFFSSSCFGCGSWPGVLFLLCLLLLMMMMLLRLLRFYSSPLTIPFTWPSLISLLSSCWTCSSIRRMSAIVSPCHWSIQQNSCRWNFVNSRRSLLNYLFYIVLSSIIHNNKINYFKQVLNELNRKQFILYNR